jgi:diguanylate cyclase (GGDEF)-like protein
VTESPDKAAGAFRSQPSEASRSDLEGAVIAIADDDPELRHLIEINLTDDGYSVVSAADGRETLDLLSRTRPELLILDVMMPGIGGIEVCRRIRADTNLKYLSVMMLSARVLPSDKLAGLSAGADDYMTKPFDIDELLARVRVALKRSRALKDLNPLTRLPGNVSILEEISRRILGGESFALMHIDIDNFKAFNDHYGLARGDVAINLLAKLCADALLKSGTRDTFLGHEGGDDLIALVAPGCLDAMARQLLAEWDRTVPDLYDEVDRQRGHIEGPDRQGNVQPYPLMTLSVGVATNVHRPIGSVWEATEIAAEMKHFAKGNTGSSYEVDKRHPGFPKR